jgi:DNA-binding Lrp family transcriptional regulator
MTLKKPKMIGEYDEFDLLILNELRDNGKMPIRQLSEKTGLHPNTLMQRIKKLEEEKVIIKYVAEINYAKLGFDLHALIFMKVDKKTRSEWEILKKLRSVPHILAIYTLTGEFDVMAIAKTKNKESLAQILKEINKNEFIVETQTQLVLDIFKHAYEFNPLGTEARLRDNGDQ